MSWPPAPLDIFPGPNYFWYARKRCGRSAGPGAGPAPRTSPPPSAWRPWASVAEPGRPLAAPLCRAGGPPEAPPDRNCPGRTRPFPSVGLVQGSIQGRGMPFPRLETICHGPPKGSCLPGLVHTLGGGGRPLSWFCTEGGGQTPLGGPDHSLLPFQTGGPEPP